MPLNSLTGAAGLKVGPVILETLISHYFERFWDRTTADGSKAVNGHVSSMTNLRQDELLYDEVFNIVKAFLEQASYHTVEEVQRFANTRTPSPPWVHVVRLLVPVSSCDEAATYLIQALGGEEVARRVVGGVKWWQVRGVKGVDAQWVTAKKDWREAKKRGKMHAKSKENLNASNGNTTSTDNGKRKASGNGDEKAEGTHVNGDAPDSGVYEEEMDEMRCILYSHGGGYYFGSVDQERYSIQRHARKINGRVFAVNYRLAPQYPFPCAIQDVLAAYLFLIRPPPGSSHRPVKPSNIVIAGDSAGGGISLAILQVIRDSGLPMPAGGILISPWCDLTHSFPSIHTNTATDVMPAWGLTMHKPSTLWPPPPDELTIRVHASLRSRIRQTLRFEQPHSTPRPSLSHVVTEHIETSPTTGFHLDPLKNQSNDGMPIEVGSTTAIPPLDAPNRQRIEIVAQSGEKLAIDEQVHFYAQNNLLAHPLISSALSYLGGLPPLLFVASDKEVSRDEINMRNAHKAANPDKYPVKEESRQVYPALVGIESRCKPTPVHLQVYDDAAHILPVLFSFTTPAKFCYRAMATFCKQVTSTNAYPRSPLSPSPMSPNFPRSISMSIDSPTPKSSFYNAQRRGLGIAADSSDSEVLTPNGRLRAVTWSDTYKNKKRSGNDSEAPNEGLPTKAPARVSLKRSLSANLSRAASILRRNHSTPSLPNLSESPPSLSRTASQEQDSETFGETGGSRPGLPSRSQSMSGARFAGDAIVYSGTPDFPPMEERMIRERVSTQGVIRPLEPETELDAFHVPVDTIGSLSELAIRRYIVNRHKFDKKFTGSLKTVEKHRRRNLDHAKKDIARNMAQLQHCLATEDVKRRGKGHGKGIVEGLLPSSGSWTWAWALDGEERPPPSSIVARRDTAQARELARVADQSVGEGDSSISANSLWGIMENFFSTPNDKGNSENNTADVEEDGEPVLEKKRSRFSKFMLG